MFALANDTTRKAWNQLLRAFSVTEAVLATALFLFNVAVILITFVVMVLGVFIYKLLVSIFQVYGAKVYYHQHQHHPLKF